MTPRLPFVLCMCCVIGCRASPQASIPGAAVVEGSASAESSLCVSAAGRETNGVFTTSIRSMPRTYDPGTLMYGPAQLVALNTFELLYNAREQHKPVAKLVQAYKNAPTRRVCASTTRAHHPDFVLYTDIARLRVRQGF